MAYCYPAVNAPPPGVPCTPFYPSGSPATGTAAALASCQTYWGTNAQQQGCIAATLGNVDGFINPFGTGVSLGTGPQTKPPPARPPSRYCIMPGGAMQYVVTGAPVPDGAKC